MPGICNAQCVPTLWLAGAGANGTPLNGLITDTGAFLITDTGAYLIYA
ncbi:MAG: hypothetical protein ABIO94_11950 [Opitutaceae bacterium]